MRRLSLEAFRALFTGTDEFAVIDPREQAVFSRGHLLAASNLPLSRLELMIEAAVPRRNALIVLCDDGEGTAERAGAVLAGLGYRDLCLLDGGISAWALSGGALFSGLNVPGKAFGEFIEQSCKTPSISARALKTRLDDGLPTVLLDTRTPREHGSFCIPGALSCPGAELVYRAFDAAEDPDALIVTHCAGRTRSIIGAQTLINAGVRHPVVALENGTMAWIFEGLELEKGADRPLAQPSDASRAESAAAAVATRHGVPEIAPETLAAWQAEASDRTLYLIDVRSAEEFAQGHLPGARQVTGGQLVQNVDRHLVTRNGRIVLLDSDGVRAPMTAAWLTQMGWPNVTVARVEPARCVVDPAPSPPTFDLIAAAELKRLLDQDRVVVADLRSSVDYRRGHLPGAWFLTRADLTRDLDRLPERAITVLVADDLSYAGLVAGDLERAGRRVRLLDGGLAAWRAAGGSLAQGLEHLASRPIDKDVDPGDFDAPAILERECRRYLDWEIALVHQIAGDPAAPYGS